MLYYYTFHRHFMHVDHELADFVPVGEPEYDEVIEEYKEEILM